MKIYVASRTVHYKMWLALRDHGVPIISTWIDESEDKSTLDFSELWYRIQREIASCDALILYGEPGDFPGKGAFIEAGMALALCKPVLLVLNGIELEGITSRPVGSWINHPRVQIHQTVAAAVHSLGVSL